MEDFQNIPFYAKYQRFTIGKATDSYRLNISGYSGDEGDSLINHNGLPFSTKDNGNTVCAVRHQGAWWYNYCYHSNLNGLYVISSYSRTGIRVNKGYRGRVRETDKQKERKGQTKKD
ncbi:Tenascin-R [Mizuhopecten yessoensis]|uniref:Tenascin-R n=1 Tax=Mizuhopecten yessoensis TaxID=6573 RepID=A0A210PTV9_MIZYE|nr:Tenascin-R [Mizuhopecten yessoensis]